MSTHSARSRLARIAVATGAATLSVLGATALTATADAQPCTSCHGDYHGEKDPEVWLDEYEWDLENTYGQSDQVVAGPDGQGDYRPHGNVPWPR